jgi:flagellar basal-body rod protein FlgB
MSSRIDEAFQFQQAALRLREARQQLIASNIANADTPNFKAKDIDFASALKQALIGTSSSVPLSVTSPQHFSGKTGESLQGATVMYRTATQPSADGNSVDMNVERAQFADNAIHYEAGMTFVGNDVKNILTMLSALQG